MAKFIQGRFKPKNPQKYKGNPNEIIYRSSWEKKFFIWADLNPSVVLWGSEELVIPYLCETDNRMHRYFPDIVMKIRCEDGSIASYLVEIKPEAQTLPPKRPKKQTKRYLYEVETFVKNQSKWKAAKAYAEARGMKFVIITERHLGLK